MLTHLAPCWIPRGQVPIPGSGAVEQDALAAVCLESFASSILLTGRHQHCSQSFSLRQVARGAFKNWLCSVVCP